MEMAKRLLLTYQTQDAEEVPTVKKNRLEMDTEETWLTPPPWALRWARWMNLMLITHMHAVTGQILMAVTQIWDRKAEKAKALYLKLVNKSQVYNMDWQPPPRKKAAPVESWKKGEVMEPPSKEVKNPLDRATCPHLESRLSNARGGQGGSKWVTCLDCGTRWRRIEMTAVPVSTSTPEPQPPVLSIYIPKAATKEVIAQLEEVYKNLLKNQGMTVLSAVERIISSSCDETELEIANFFALSKLASIMPYGVND
jgi:hypothetical protein